MEIQELKSQAKQFVSEKYVYTQMESCVRKNHIDELKFNVERVEMRVQNHHEEIPALEERLNKEVEAIRSILITQELLDKELEVLKKRNEKEYCTRASLKDPLSKLKDKADTAHETGL